MRQAYKFWITLLEITFFLNVAIFQIPAESVIYKEYIMPNSSPQKILYCPMERCDYEVIHKQKCCLCDGLTDWEYHNSSLGELTIKVNPQNSSRAEVINPTDHQENLYKLQFNKHLLTSFPEKLCNFKELVIIELRNNMISQIGDISCLDILDTLDLSGNQIRDINDLSFKYNLNLRILDLSNNMLATMSPSILPPLALSSLFLQNNYIRSYDVSNLGIMMSRPFCRIDISYNKLNEKAITNEQNLTFGNIEPGGQGSVNFQHNSLKTFPEFIEKMELKNLSEVSRLWDYHMDIRNNPIRCDCILVPIMEMIRPLLNVVQAFKVFLDIPCFNPTQLRGRSIYNITKTGDWENMTCPLYVINDCPRGCKCFYKLSGKRVNFLREEKTVFVNCTGSGLNELPHVLPKGDEYSIDFSGNNISVVRPRNYLGFTVMLNLSQNRLHKIDSRCVKLMRKTSKIILTKNIGLVKIPRSLKHLNSCGIEFPEVYLVCTCDNIWIKDWLVKNHINSDKTVCNIDKFFCRTSTGIIPLIRFTAETLTCTRNDLYARSLLITSVTSIVVLIGTVWLLSYFRYEIMILLRKERLKLKQTPSYHEYDIFISFDEGREDIRKWVIKTFIPLLQSLGYSFYVPMISLPFGEIRTEETERVVQKCRSFLVVLSDDYLGEETIWTSFEFKLIWKLFYAKPTLNMLIVNFDVVGKSDILNRPIKALFNLGYFIDFHNQNRDFNEQMKKILGKIDRAGNKFVRNVTH